MIRTQKIKYHDAKCIFFCIFNIKEMKTKGFNKNLIYKPYYKKKETNQGGYQEANTQPKMQGQPMKQK
jgi:hypothetical protein